MCIRWQNSQGMVLNSSHLKNRLVVSASENSLETQEPSRYLFLIQLPGTCALSFIPPVSAFNKVRTAVHKIPQGKKLGPKLSVRLTVASSSESKEAAVAVNF